MQEQIAFPLRSRHWALGPHGEGWQGFVGTSMRTGLHKTNGLPVMPSGQRHIAVCLMLSHKALRPQAPGQGSVHLLRTHVLSRAQSELSTHSGRQPT